MKNVGFFATLAFLACLIPILAFAQGSLSEALQKVSDLAARGEVPVAIFDLDETLIDSSPRQFQSYQDAFTQLRFRNPILVRRSRRMRLQSIESLDNRYSATELFHSLRVKRRAFIRRAERLMMRTFLRSSYVDLDREIPCAVSFVRQLEERGAFVYFVSSRYQSLQGEATNISLEHLGFVQPGERFEAILRPDGMGSLTFKKSAFRKIAQTTQIEGKHAQVLLLFENEPENINAMVDQFPTAGAYFVRGASYSTDPLSPAVQQIDNYCN